MTPRTTISAACLLFSLTAGTARGDYGLPPVEERVLLKVEAWQLDEERELRVTHGQREFNWSLDLFWLADRIDSDSICTGGHEESMRAYLSALRREKRSVAVCRVMGDKRIRVKQEVPVALWVELVRTKDSELFVAGLWPVREGEAEVKSAYEQASRSGSQLLGISPEAVQALGGPEEYAKRLQEKSAAGWRRVSQN